MPNFRRFCIFVLAAFCAISVAAAEPYEHPYPEALQINVETETWPSEAYGALSVDIPITALDGVNENLRNAAQSLFDQITKTDCDRINIQAAYRVSGTKWAGFLLLGRAVSVEAGANDVITVEDTLKMIYTVQTYDMETGAALTLNDVFSSDSSAWPRIEAAARELLYSYYPDEQRDEETLAAMVTRDSLASRAFLPGPGQLLVPFSLALILPDHPQIAYLKLPYPDYRALMRPQAMLQTDNSTRPMIALTLDDGPTRIYTQAILTALGHYGAGATFFCVGNTVLRQPDMVRREMDLGCTVAAHSMTHENPWEQSNTAMLAEVDTQKTLYTTVTGLPVSLLRPPGGDLKTYVSRHIGWPLIRWNKSLSDTGDGNARDLAWRIKNNAAHGDIFLMHDVREKTADAVPLFLEALTERGYMFPTVDELLYLNGITPQPDVAYYDGLGAKTYPKDAK